MIKHVDPLFDEKVKAAAKALKVRFHFTTDTCMKIVREVCLSSGEIMTRDSYLKDMKEMDEIDRRQAINSTRLLAELVGWDAEKAEKFKAESVRRYFKDSVYGDSVAVYFHRNGSIMVDEYYPANK